MGKHIIIGKSQITLWIVQGLRNLAKPKTMVMFNYNSLQRMCKYWRASISSDNRLLHKVYHQNNIHSFHESTVNSLSMWDKSHAPFIHKRITLTNSRLHTLGHHTHTIVQFDNIKKNPHSSQEGVDNCFASILSFLRLKSTIAYQSLK